MEMVILKMDGTIQEVKNDNDHVTLQELYKAIDTNIVEPVYLSSEMMLIVDEEGKLKGRGINRLATDEMVKAIPGVFDHIVGDAVLIERKYMR